MQQTNIIMTGDVHVGKSTLLQKALALLDEDYCGIFCRPVFENGERVGYGLTRTDGSEPDVFAHRDFQSDLSLGPFKCNLRPFARAATYLQHCLSEGAHLVVIDEIGVIEKSASAYVEAVIKILDSPVSALFVVQRRAAYFWEMLASRKNWRLYEAALQNRDALPRMLAEELQALLLKNKT